MLKTELENITRIVQNIVKNHNERNAFDLVSKPLNYSNEWLPEALLLFSVAKARDFHPMLRNIFGIENLSPKLASVISQVNAKLGCYSFSFPQWRYLSQSFNDASLFEHYGMSRLRRHTDIADPALPEPHKDLYGPGFCWQNDDWYIEYRRAYIICSSLKQDDLATVVVRNSSYYFGRNRLPAPVYISFENLTPKDLKNLNPESFNQEGRFLKWQDFLISSNKQYLEEKVRKINHLLNFFAHFDKKISIWLQEDGLNNLRAFLDTRMSLMYPGAIPCLAVIDENMPQWYVKSSLPVNQKLIKHFKKTDLTEIFAFAKQPGNKLVLLSGPEGDLTVKPAP